MHRRHVLNVRFGNFGRKWHASFLTICPKVLKNTIIWHYSMFKKMICFQNIPAESEIYCHFGKTPEGPVHPVLIRAVYARFAAWCYHIFCRCLTSSGSFDQMSGLPKGSLSPPDLFMGSGAGRDKGFFGWNGGYGLILIGRGYIGGCVEYNVSDGKCWK